MALKVQTVLVILDNRNKRAGLYGQPETQVTDHL